MGGGLFQRTEGIASISYSESSWRMRKMLQLHLVDLPFPDHQSEGGYMKSKEKSSLSIRVHEDLSGI